LKEFISRFRFDRLGVFRYSHEEDTFSFREYSDDIPEEVKESRVASLMEVQQNISSELNEKIIGSTVKVLIDRKDGEYFSGRTEYDSPEVDQEVLIPVKYNLEIGKFYNILIKQSAEFDLFGEPVY
jgi:ribosomal protein S12 methylthiotransferase